MQDAHAGESMEQQEIAYQKLQAVFQRQVESSAQWLAMGQCDQPAHALGEGAADGPGEQPSQEEMYWDVAYLCYVRKGNGKG